MHHSKNFTTAAFLFSQYGRQRRNVPGLKLRFVCRPELERGLLLTALALSGSVGANCADVAPVTDEQPPAAVDNVHRLQMDRAYLEAVRRHSLPYQLQAAAVKPDVGQHGLGGGIPLQPDQRAGCGLQYWPPAIELQRSDKRVSLGRGCRRRKKQDEKADGNSVHLISVDAQEAWKEHAKFSVSEPATGFEELASPSVRGELSEYRAPGLGHAPRRTARTL